jgi:hypothetical protein
MGERKVESFDLVPKSLSSGTYYTPLSTNFPTVDALTDEAGVQSTVTDLHPIRDVKTVERLGPLFPDGVLPLVFVVPEPLAANFKRQQVITSKGMLPAVYPRVWQYVAGLPVGIDTSLDMV